VAIVKFPFVPVVCFERKKNHSGRENHHSHGRELYHTAEKRKKGRSGTATGTAATIHEASL
jgi:hypothetical protein